MHYRSLPIIITLALFGATALAHKPTEVVLTPESEPRPAGQDQGITSPFHGKSVGKILFSIEEVAVKPSASAFRTSFSGKDTIYGRVFVNRSIKNTPVYKGASKITSVNPSWEVRLFVDGKNQAVSFGSLFQRPTNKEPGEKWCT